MKSIANVFLKGLLFIMPLFITFGLLYWLFAAAENLLKVPLQWILPEGWYVTGMGVVSAIAIVFCVGILVQAYIIKYFFAFLESTVEHIPIVKTLYTSAKDLMMFFAGDQEKKMNRVVSVTFDQNLTLIGFVTNEDVSIGERDELIAVYFPMSYQVGGYTVFMPKSRCEPLDIPVQRAMQQVLTAHVQRPHKAR